jgi:lipoprotein signal peptidase
MVLRVGPLHTGIFNVADVIIMSGTGMLAFALWQQNRPTSGKIPQGVRAE